MKVDYFKVFTLIMNVTQAIQVAAEDGQITYGEAVEIGYKTAKQTLDMLGLTDKPLVVLDEDKGYD